MNAADYYYNYYQPSSSITGALPTYQQAPVYTVNAVFLAYRYKFK
jgi:hypothetical protein